MRNSYIKGLTSQHNFRKQESERTANQFDTDAYVKDGVVRWKSNNNIPPKDILEFWQYLGKEFDYNKTLAVDEEETTVFFENYRKQQANRQYTEEELFEMRAAFGPGETVVNVITGKQIKL